MSLSKTQKILFHFLDSAFEVFGGVPGELLTDNMTTIMDHARTETSKGKVNHSSMIHYADCQYSVPPEYVDKYLTIQAFDGYIHIYDNLELVTVHAISKNKLNYHKEHYVEIAKKSHAFKDDEKIEERAKANLSLIGGFYKR